MTVPVQRVQPGDLITSSFVNSLIDTLVDLDRRIASLEAGVTTSRQMMIFSPTPTDTFHVGDEMRILGQGFGIPALNTVTFDNTARVATFKTGSSENLLIIDVPNLILPQQGKVVTMAVSNATGFAQTSFNLLPEVPKLPVGTISMNQVASPQQLVQAPGFDLFYNVGAAVNLAETYVVGAQLTNAPGWQAFLADAQNNKLTPSELQLGAFASGQMHIRVVVPNGASGTAQLVVTVASKTNPASNTNPNGITTASTGILSLPVGGLAPGADKIGVAFNRVFAPAAFDGISTFTVPRNQTGTIGFMVTLPPGAPAANYTATLAFDQGATGWGAPQITDPQTSPPNAATCRFPNATGQKTILVNIAPQGNTQPTNLTITVTADADPNNVRGSRTFAFHN